MTSHKTIYHITSKALWQRGVELGAYHHESLKTEGFIHAAYAHQLDGVIERYFSNWTRAQILCIDLSRVEADVRLEGPAEHGGPFPHIYGPLNLDAVERILTALSGEEGRLRLPADIPQGK